MPARHDRRISRGGSEGTERLRSPPPGDRRSRAVGRSRRVQSSPRRQPSEPADVAIGLLLFQLRFALMAILAFPRLTSMPVTIMFGLAFATLLTLIVVPLLYAVLFRIRDHAPT